MVEEIVVCMEQVEKNQQELWEILERDPKEHRKQMAQMMQVIMRLSQEKKVVDDVGSVNIAIKAQGVIESPMYHPASLQCQKWEFLTAQSYQW